ncbi:MAG: hypothetical protein LC751_04000 [Actinobacteria bacterium]|nr:hypothetical protein [Actinomycetota bacterium]
MVRISVAHPAPQTTRFERGITLEVEYFEEITRVAPWIWSVPSCSGPGVHAVSLKTYECSFPDRTPEGETDKHVVAARYVKARTATCAGCGERFSLPASYLPWLITMSSEASEGTHQHTGQVWDNDHKRRRREGEVWAEKS